MDVQTISLISTISLAFVGYVVTYANNVRLENRKARLKFVSDQLQYLYGPLFSLSHASNQAWQSFRSRCRPGKPFFEPGHPPSKAELEQWHLWMTEVFMPLNLQIEKAIVENSHLIDGVMMPKPFLDVLAHIEVYKAIFKKWSNDDYRERSSYVNWPEEFSPYVCHVYENLKFKQAKIMSDIEFNSKSKLPFRRVRTSPAPAGGGSRRRRGEG